MLRSGVSEYLPVSSVERTVVLHERIASVGANEATVGAKNGSASAHACGCLFVLEFSILLQRFLSGS